MKQLEDLTVQELVEDIGYWLNYAQHQSPPFVDPVFSNIWESLNELALRFKN